MVFQLLESKVLFKNILTVLSRRENDFKTSTCIPPPGALQFGKCGDPLHPGAQRSDGDWRDAGPGAQGGARPRGGGGAGRQVPGGCGTHGGEGANSTLTLVLKEHPPVSNFDREKGCNIAFNLNPCFSELAPPYDMEKCLEMAVSREERADSLGYLADLYETVDDLEKAGLYYDMWLELVGAETSVDSA